jgi:RNA polymerase sigma-70 factor (ECF subfamily)
MDEDDDRRWSALMLLAQRGDGEAYAQLLTETSEAIAGYLVHRFGRPHFTEDCVQESLLALHRARHSFRPELSFRAWLFAIVRHKAIDFLRRDRAESRYLDRDIADHEVAAVEVPPDSVVDGNGAALLMKLKPVHREALTLTKVCGLTHAEAAARIGISESAMKVRVHRAVRAAASLLGGERP